MQIVGLAVVGLSAGILISGGMYALITTLGIINRIAQDTHTAKDILIYEECVIWGSILGNLFFLYGQRIGAGMPTSAFASFGLAMFGLVAGIYAGCLAVALAEVIKTIPVFLTRSKIQGPTSIGWIVLMMALGKCMGGLIYFFVFYR